MERLKKINRKTWALLLVIAMMAALLIGVGFRVEAEDKVRNTVLVLDMSSEMNFTEGNTIIYTSPSASEEVKTATKAFLSNIKRNEGNKSTIIDKVAIVSFDGAATVEADFSSDMDYLAGVVDSMTASANGSVDRSIAAGLSAANSLLDGVKQTEETNVVLFSTGHSFGGEYSYNGPYDESTIGSRWINSSTGVKIYAYANSAIEKASQLKEKGTTIYSVGLFQSLEGMPEGGQDIVAFFKLVAKDLATSENEYFPLDNPSDLPLTFGRVAEEITEETIDADGFPIATLGFSNDGSWNNGVNRKLDPFYYEKALGFGFGTALGFTLRYTSSDAICYGMAALTSLLNNGSLDPKGFGINELTELNQINWDTTTKQVSGPVTVFGENNSRSIVEPENPSALLLSQLFWMSQHSDEHTKKIDVSRNCQKDEESKINYLNGLVPVIKKQINNHKSVPLDLKGESSGHTVVPYGYKETNNYIELLVYDCSLWNSLPKDEKYPHLFIYKNDKGAYSSWSYTWPEFANGVHWGSDNGYLHYNVSFDTFLIDWLRKCGFTIQNVNSQDSYTVSNKYPRLVISPSTLITKGLKVAGYEIASLFAPIPIGPTVLPLVVSSGTAAEDYLAFWTENKELEINLMDDYPLYIADENGCISICGPESSHVRVSEIENDTYSVVIDGVKAENVSLTWTSKTAKGEPASITIVGIASDDTLSFTIEKDQMIVEKGLVEGSVTLSSKGESAKRSFSNVVQLEIDNEGHALINLTDHLYLNSPKKPVESISVSDRIILCGIGSEVDILYSISPKDASYDSISFESADESVIKVTQDGKMIATGLGTTTITVTADGISSSAEIGVMDSGHPVEYTFRQKEIIIPVGETVKCNYYALNDKGNPVSGKSMYFKSSDTSLFTVDRKGNFVWHKGEYCSQVSINGLKSGTGKLLVYESLPMTGEPFAEYTVHVGNLNSDIETLDLVISGPSTIKVGEESAKIWAFAENDNGERLTNKTITWSNSNPKVATVEYYTNEDGYSYVRAVGKKAGKTVITAEAEGKKGTLTITVQAKSIFTVFTDIIKVVTNRLQEVHNRRLQRQQAIRDLIKSIVTRQ